jgi:ketosteroid isomerase-like protein
MRGLTITLGAACLAVSFTACSTEPAAETDEQSIHKAYTAWVEATNEKDIEKWSAFLAPGPYFHPADSSPLVNTEEIISYYERSFADQRFSIDCRQEYVDVSASGEMAWSRGQCTATFTGPDGNQATGKSRWFKVWIKQSDGSWRCRVNTWRNMDNG